MLIVCSLVLMASCEKEGEFHPFKKREKECAIVEPNSVPTNVQSTLNERATGVKNLVWFDKDGTAYCAVFTLDGIENKVLIDLNGKFISQESENEDEDEDSGCECEIDDEN